MFKLTQVTIISVVTPFFFKLSTDLSTDSVEKICPNFVRGNEAMKNVTNGVVSV